MVATIDLLKERNVDHKLIRVVSISNYEFHGPCKMCLNLMLIWDWKL